MKTILAIDPGSAESGYVVFDSMGQVIKAEIVSNIELRSLLEDGFDVDICAVEMIASYGMAVGREVFDTCIWIGRFYEVARLKKPLPVHFVFRRDIKTHLCGTVKAKDTNIRQALIDKYGAPGTKKNQGKTYGIKSHLWAALAVADYALCHFAA